MKHLKSGIFMGLLGSSILACASHAPMALHADLAYAHPDRETCAAESGTPYRLTVHVRDEVGAALPTVSVFLFPMHLGAEAGVVLRTDETGAAVAQPAGEGAYSVLVSIAGFEPQVRALTIRPGCSGSTTFVLRVGPGVVER